MAMRTIDCHVSVPPTNLDLPHEASGGFRLDFACPERHSPIGAPIRFGITRRTFPVIVDGDQVGCPFPGCLDKDRIARMG